MAASFRFAPWFRTPRFAPPVSRRASRNEAKRGAQVFARSEANDAPPARSENEAGAKRSEAGGAKRSDEAARENEAKQQAKPAGRRAAKREAKDAKRAREIRPDAHANEALARGQWPGVLVALAAATALVALLAFAITAHGLYGFAREVWRLPVLLAAAAAVNADLLSLCGVFATYALRHSRWQVRLYAWLTFLLFNLLSVAGNEAYAAHQDLEMPGRVAAAVAPVALAFATHMLVVVRRELEAAQRAVGEALATTRSDCNSDPAIADGRTPKPLGGEDQLHVQLSPQDADLPPAAIALQVTQRKNKSSATRPRNSARQAADPSARRGYAVREVENRGRSAAEVAREIGATPRAVQMWVKQHREDGHVSASAQLNGATVHAPGVIS
jgi:hypothetical protein